jgi:hypothetical protein
VIAGALLSFAVAAWLFARFGDGALLERDEAIYAYGGQQLADGVAFYASIFDIKTPLASQIAGLGVVVGRALGADDLEAIRAAFFVCASATAGAMYLLGRWLWRSQLAALLGVAVFAAFRGFAEDAGGGPDAKTPGILFAVASMALVVRGRWFWAALAGSLAFLVWQPLLVYPVLTVIAAALAAGAGRRGRAAAEALAGALLPLAVTAVYFWRAGALHDLVQAAFEFPVDGLARGHETLAARIDDIADTTQSAYGLGRFLLWGGVALLLAVAAAGAIRRRADLGAIVRDPLYCVVVPSLVAILVYSGIDFQGYPDLYPVLPYAALGIGGAAALLLELLRSPAARRVATTAGALGAGALVVVCGWWYAQGANAHVLPRQRGRAAAIDRLVDPGETLYALGDPTPLVLTGRRNPSRFVYLSSGVGQWVADRTPGGLAGWVRSIRAADPAVVVMHGWKSALATRMARRLGRRYDEAWLGNWRLFLRPGVAARAPRRGVVLHGLRAARAPGRAAAPAPQ